MPAAGIAHLPLGPSALTLSDRELVARGFPRRPDKIKAPGAYAKWTYIVSHTFTAVAPRKVRRGDVSFAPVSLVPQRRAAASSAKSVFDYNSSIWSGAVVSNPQVRFYEIQDDWMTPSAGPVPPSIGYAAVAVWAGLDNAGNDLVQTGTDSESWDFYDGFGTEVTFTNYWAWIESLPDAPYALPNFPVSPGDSISVDIFLADQTGNTTLSGGDLTPSDDSVWFMIYNLTTGNSYWGTLPRPPAFSGSTAEFVLERPSSYDTGVPFALADFGVVGAHDCYFADTWFGFSSLDYNGSPPYPFSLDNLTMLDGSNTLTSSFTFANLSGQPGGGNELWVWQNYL
ncbi:MAG: G1 family endopeptidase [Candidatus Eremiobacteraeota bacterium]|nr:G1 family endopeptidase [Candidatus Eremiobacteraeota bacterium]